MAEDFGIDLVELVEVLRGADPLARVWRAVSADGSEYAVKCGGGGSPAGMTVPAGLAARGVPGVPAPVPARDGALWSERDGRRLSLVPWVRGQGALGGGMTAEHWVAFGRLLARVHACPAPPDLPREEHTSHHRWVPVARSLHERLRTGEGHLVRALAECWNPDLVSTVFEWADRLGRELCARDTPGVLCHGDPHLGNVLLDDGEVWLVDWDDAVLASPERDLLFVLGGVLAFAPVDRRRQAWFFEGYGPARIDPVRLAYHRCARTLEDLLGPAVEVVEGDVDAPAVVRDVLSPTGLATRTVASLAGLEHRAM